MTVMAVLVQARFQFFDPRRQPSHLLLQGGLHAQQLLGQRHHRFWPSLIHRENLVLTQHRMLL